MARRVELDMEVLRSFVAGFELGSFARAAERLGRSQSAVSTRLRRLEEQAGQALVRRSGRGLAPTAAGEILLGYARRLLELNDEAVERLRGAAAEGSVRLGLPQDFAESWLPGVLRRFGRGHPLVRVEIEVGGSAELAAKVAAGGLDLALAWDEGEGSPRAERVAAVPMRWIAAVDWPGAAEAGNGEPLAFAAFSPPCRFRAAGLSALDAAGMAWRLSFTSPSLSGLWAAAEGGLGITVRTTIGMPDRLVAIEPGTGGLPALPAATLWLHRAEAEPGMAVRRLGEMLLEAVREGGAGAERGSGFVPGPEMIG